MIRAQRGWEAAIAAGMALASMLAAAEEKPSLAAVAVTLPYHTGSPTSAAAQAAAGQAVLRAERFSGRDLIDLIDAPGLSARREAKRKAQSRFQSGRDSFDNLDLEKAAQYFSEAADLYREADQRTGFDDYINARVWHAACRYLNGDKPGAQKEFTRVFVEAPRLVLDKQAFPPDLLGAAERARSAVQADMNASLTVSSTPAALAWVDGRLAGPTPATVHGLAAGEHSIVVGAPGFLLASSHTSNGQAQVTLSKSAGRDFEAIRAQVAADFFAVDRTPRLAAVARSLGLEQVLFVAVEEKSGTVHLLRVTSDGHPLAGAEGNAGAPPAEEIARLAPQVLGKDVPPEAQRALLSVEQRTGQSSSGINIPGLAPWFAGGALVLAGGSVLFGLLAAHDRSQYLQTPQTNTSASSSLASSTSTNAVVADVFGVTAGVVAATAASFWFTPGLWGWHPRPAGAIDSKPDDKEKEKKKEKDAEEDLRESLQLVPAVLPNGGGAVLSARF